MVSPIQLFLHKVSLATLATFNCLDAKAIASDHVSDTVYSTPNMTFVPEPHNDEEELCGANICVDMDKSLGTVQVS